MWDSFKWVRMVVVGGWGWNSYKKPTAWVGPPPMAHFPLAPSVGMTDCLLASLGACLLGCLPAWLTAHAWLAACLADCLLGWLPAWLTACLAGCLLGWLPAWLAACLAGWLLGRLPAWLPACLAACLLGCLAAYQHAFLLSFLPAGLPACLVINEKNITITVCTVHCKSS